MYPCSACLLLRYVLHIISICHDFRKVRKPEQSISTSWSRSKVNAIEHGTTVASTSSSSIIRVLRSWHRAEKSSGWVSWCSKERLVTWSERTKELLPASFIAKLLTLFYVCFFFNIISQSLIWTFRYWALSNGIEVMKVISPRRDIIALLVYKSYMTFSIGNLIDTLPSSFIHRELQPGFHLIRL